MVRPDAYLDTQIDRLIELIGHVQRWPEVITFEEMNEKPPLYLLTHALGKVMREEDNGTTLGRHTTGSSGLETVT